MIESLFAASSAPPPSDLSLLLLLVAIAAATLVSEDLTCIATGLMVGAGRLGYLPGTLACITGIFIGDLLLYLAGRWLGRPAVRRRPLRWMIGEDDLERGSRWLRRRGALAILISRFLPGTRLGTYFVAGLLHTSLWRFAGYFLLAVLAWTPPLVALAAWLGESAQGHLQRFGHAAWLLVLLALGLLAVVRLSLALVSRHGRRRLRGRWQRMRRWEYWPRWVFYPPVVVYIVLLGLRHRHPTLFTAANPAIPASGFVGESKSDILRGLGGSSPLIARWCTLEAALDLPARKRRVERFLDRYELSLPLVIKPDVGERGRGVRVIRDQPALRVELEMADETLIVQEYISGEEFGVFYLRLPGEPRGRLFSITEKVLPAVEGDGKRTLEQLILADGRLLPMAEHYLEARSGELDEVLDPGQSRRLIDVGTHSKGAFFDDAAELASDELLAVFDGVAERYPGFFFGRFDLRVPSREHLRRGQGLRILELNGVTSEATHIYSPETRLIEAYRTLFEQWRLAFEIGRRNLQRGYRPASMRQLLGLLVER